MVHFIALPEDQKFQGLKDGRTWSATVEMDVSLKFR